MFAAIKTCLNCQIIKLNFYNNIENISIWINYINCDSCDMHKEINLLHRIEDEGVCRVSTEPSGRGMLTRNTRRALVLLFFEPATPMRASTSALRSFNIPTQSTLHRQMTLAGKTCRSDTKLYIFAKVAATMTMWHKNIH